MSNQFNQIIYRVVAQECERFPSRKLSDIWASCKERLIEFGIPSRLINNISDTYLRSIFTWTLVPNPLYWRRFNNKFYFYLIKVPSKRYSGLLDSLKTQLANVSFFVCYGELDVIIRWIGNEESVDQIENLLTSWGAPPATIEIRNIPLYYRYAPNANIRNTQLEPERIDHIFSTSPEELNTTMITELINSGIALGAVYLEDTHITNRIHAFIGIKFDGPIETITKRQFEQALLLINEEQSQDHHNKPLLSIYQCGLHYDYFLEVIAENHDQLDIITDKIQRIHNNIFDTETLILAKSHFSPVKLRQKHESAEKYTILQSIMTSTLTLLVDSLSQNFSGKLEIAFRQSDSETQFLALSLYRDIWLKNPHSDKEWFISIKEYFADFIYGILEKKHAQIWNSIFNLIRDVIEKQHKNFIEIIINNCFSGNGGLLQRELKTDDANWQRWGLAKWANHVYPKWNDHKLYGSIVKFSEEFLRSLEFVGEIRNWLAHQPTTQNIDHLIHESRQVFYHSSQILAYLLEITPILEKPTIPLNTIRSIAFSGPQSSYFELLQIIRRLQVDVQNLIQLMEQQSEISDIRWRELIVKLTQLRSGIDRVDQRTFELIEELVIPKIVDRDKNRAQQLIDYLKMTAQTLPAEFVANILWGIISSIFLG